MDAEDLDRKAAASGAKVLLMSYMRGHVPDMDAVMDVVRKHNLIFIEDCAHAYETRWNGQLLGTFGEIGCFSTQSSKGLSAGEGGLFVTNNDEYAAKAVLYVRALVVDLRTTIITAAMLSAIHQGHPRPKLGPAPLAHQRPPQHRDSYAASSSGQFLRHHAVPPREPLS